MNATSSEEKRAGSKRSLPIFERAFQHAALGDARDTDAQHRPLYVVWEITTACDHACRHCGSRSGHRRPDELGTDACLDVVTQLRALGATEVTLIGGEAYLRDDFTQIARAITDGGMACSVTTGGRGIDEGLACAMLEAGISTVSVSVDGTAETHDRIRGVKGSHASALRAIGDMRRAGLRVAVNTQVNRLTYEHLDAVMDMMVERGVTRFQPIMTVPMGRAADHDELLLQPYELLDVFPRLAAIKQRADREGILFIPSNNVGYFGPYEHVLRGNFRVNHAGGCGAGRVTMGIEADGSIKGCPGLPSDAYVGGNVREHSLREIWERGIPLRYTRDRTKDDLWGFCRDCYYAEPCMAGCTWASHTFFGRPGNNPYCHHRALDHHERGLRERLVRKHVAPGRAFDHGLFEVVVEPLEGSV